MSFTVNWVIVVVVTVTAAKIVAIASAMLPVMVNVLSCRHSNDS